MDNYKVYIKTNEKNLVTAIEGGLYPPTDITNWVLIDEGVQYPKYTHPQGNYLDKTLINLQGCHNYKYASSKVVETTAEEKATELASFPAPAPTEAERLASAEKAIAILMGV